MVTKPSYFGVNLPQLRAEFGSGRAGSLVQECQTLNIKKPLLVGTASVPGRYAELVAQLEQVDAAHFFAAQPHCPQETVEACRADYLEQQCDGVIAIGGGSTLGLGKILAAEEGAIFIALPTTYSGSEVTAIYGRKVDGEKRTQVNPSCRPDLIIYDAELSQNLPADESVMSGMNSIAHAVDALYAQNAGPLTVSLAREALSAHKQGLAAVARQADNQETGLRANLKAHLKIREQLVYAGFIGGLLVSMHGIALHHQMCHVIGGLFDVPHGASNSIMLPHAVAYNQGLAPQADELIAEIFAGGRHGDESFANLDPAQSLYDFARSINAPAALKDFGVPLDAAEQIAQRQVDHGGWNPRPMSATVLQKLVVNLIEGRPPTGYE